MSEYYVLDTGAILSRSVNLLSGNNVTTDSVLNEIRMGKLASTLNVIRDLIETRSPSPESIKVAKDAATKSGDLSFLSDTDLEVIALAHEVKGTLLTDDYSVLNVCSFLGIRTETIEKKGISRKFKWEYRCSGCGRAVNSKICPVCGHEAKRYSVKSRNMR